MIRFCPTVLALSLAACASQPAPAPRAAAEPPPDHRKLVAENQKSLFSAESHARNVAISELRQVPSAVGLTWATCVRASAVNINGKPIAPRTYVVTFSRNAIAERRLASGDDCAGAVFEPLGAG